MLGGEQKVRELVDHFYDLMDNLPEAWDIRKIHASDLSDARNKLFKFLSGWLGGPSLYIEEYGHPKLRMRHMPFKIGMRERTQWLLCMHQAMDALGVQGPLRENLEDAFARTAEHMQNQPA